MTLRERIVDGALLGGMWLLVAAFGFCLFMAAYEGTKDRGQCLASESYTYDQPIQVGSYPVGNGVSMPIYTYVPQTGTRCTRWEYPEGRPRG